MGSLLATLAKQIAVSVICQKALKAFGKKDYADVTRLAGWCLYGATLVNIFQYIMENSKVIGFFKWLF